MPRLTINDMEIEVEAGTSVLQAAEQLGIEIPRFCYHDKLSVAGNCRMCLVEIEGGPPKPVASCALACADGMSVRTDTEMVKKAQRSVMEMLLANHPLDCPICDQGGECDLQDQAVAYGFDRSRFNENKRAVSEKAFGPLIATAMTRCINCTRCIRFLDEIAGTPSLGQVNRGEDAEIDTFVPDIIRSELSGNIIDICPVGALTSKPYKFKARSWELRKTESISVHDALGCNIRIDSRGREVMRILPRLNEGINESWIDDRTRFACDGLAHQRLDRPYVRNKQSGKLVEASWADAFQAIAENVSGVSGDEMAALAGDLVDVESMVALKDLMLALDCPHLDCRTDGTQINTEDRASYIFNSTIAGIDEADAIFLIGGNPRRDATMVNARIRKNWLEKRTPIYRIGETGELTYPYEHLGNNPADIEKLMKKFGGGELNAKKPMMIVSNDIFAREDALVIHALVHKCAERLGVVQANWNGFNILHKAASRVGGLDIGFLPQEQRNGKRFAEIVAGTKDGSIKTLFMLGVDEFNARVNIGWQTFVVYLGHHGDHGAERADVILPSAAYTEKDGTYVNTEGRPQLAKRAVSPPGEAREEWKIVRELSQYVLRKPLPYGDATALNKRIKKEWPVFKALYQVTPSRWALYKHKGKLQKDSFLTLPGNYYYGDSICRASPTMRKCVESFGDVGDTRKVAAQ
ncbi:MAG: NADH-quinone oxidoreductase subunit NuoG [Alphaproteobacteria bacterium]